MTEYIKREDAMEIVKRTSGDYAAAWSEIRKLPAADVAEVWHGRWVHCYEDGIATCSECGNTEYEQSCGRFCSYCGAKMANERRLIDGKRVADIVNHARTVDAVEVVRCKDCEHFLRDLSGRENHLCMRRERGFVLIRKLDDFCSYGERWCDNG